MNKYDGFDDLEDIKKQFESECDNVKEEEILFASYGGGCYSGDAFILIERDGKLYTVEGGHCSCYGLEGQWDMIETTKDVLRKRSIDEEYHPELVQFLKGFLAK